MPGTEAGLFCYEWAWGCTDKEQSNKMPPVAKPSLQELVLQGNAASYHVTTWSKEMANWPESQKIDVLDTSLVSYSGICFIRVIFKFPTWMDLNKRSDQGGGSFSYRLDIWYMGFPRQHQGKSSIQISRWLHWCWSHTAHQWPSASKCPWWFLQKEGGDGHRTESYQKFNVRTGITAWIALENKEQSSCLMSLL